MSVRLSRNNSAHTRRILIIFDIWGFFSKKSVDKIQVSLKSDTNNERFTWWRKNIYDNVSLNSFLEWEMSQTKDVDKIKTHILRSNTFYCRKSYRLWDNVQKYGTARRDWYSAPVQTAPGAHPASYSMGTGSFPGVKRPGCDVDLPPPSIAEAKERV